MAPPPVRIVPPSEIDAASVGDLSSALSGVDPSDSVLVDCSAVTFIDSSGIRVLLEGSQRQREGGGTLHVYSPSQVVRRILELTGLTDFITEP